MAEQRATKRTLDFTNVKDAGEFNPKHKPEGDYRAVITKVTESISKNQNDMWTFHVQLKDDRSAVYPHRCTLNEVSLWKIRNLFVAAGKTVPKKKLNVDPNVIVGKEIGIALLDEEYDGKMKSVIDSVFPADDLEEDETEEVDEVEEETPRRTTKKAAAKKPARKVEDEEEDVDEEDEEIMDVDDL